MAAISQRPTRALKRGDVIKYPDGRRAMVAVAEHRSDGVRLVMRTRNGAKTIHWGVVDPEKMWPVKVQ